MSRQDHRTIHSPEIAGRRRRPDVSRRQRPACRAGFTIVECLIGLAISAILLTALATAFHASVMNYGENEQMYETINNARQALTRMTSQLRTGHWVEWLEPDNRCRFTTAQDQDITYEFRSADHKLYLITNSDNREYVLCDNVTGTTFTKTPTDSTLDPEGMYNDCKSVEISLTVQAGDFQRTLAAAAVIRRNLPF